MRIDKLYMAERKEPGTFLYHAACPQCRSEGRDRSGNNLGVYQHDDGHKDATCFACHHYIKNYVEEGHTVKKQVIKNMDIDSIKSLPSIELVDRFLDQQTVEFYGVKSRVVDGKEVERYYPITKNSGVTGFKKRTLPKTFGGSVGDCSGATELFGQSKFKAGGKILIITAGEEDAMSAYRMTAFKSPSKRGYASVSLVNGASDEKAIKNNLEWINSFESVVFAVDQEELDINNAKKFCTLLEPGKGKIATFPYKDANEMCKAKKFTQFYQAIWQASESKPSGIIEGADIWKNYANKTEITPVRFPEKWGMGGFSYGLYFPSLAVVTAGTGVGKSTVLKEMQHHIYKTTVYNMGIISMEEPVSRCSAILAGIEMGQRITLPDVKVNEEEVQKTYKKLFGDDRFVFCENTGIREPEDLYSKIRFMANARDCKFIFLDHLTAIVNKFKGIGNKNDYTEHLVNTLNDLSLELDVCLILVSHVRKTGGDSDETYETGKVPTEDSIFGSSSIKQYSSLTLAISRDKSESSSPVFIHVLKDRLGGDLGKSRALFYDKVTGRLEITK